MLITLSFVRNFVTARDIVFAVEGLLEYSVGFFMKNYLTQFKNEIKVIFVRHVILITFALLQS
jgi:hypothetical protein